MSTVIGGRYSLEQVLGQGGMATVYEARDATLNRTVALKMLRPELYGDAAAQARFGREARIAASFSHPHIARVYDVGEDAVYGPFFIQELVPGQSLDELLPAHAPQALGWVREIAGALAAAHARGLVHCDVKPQNVRVTPEGKAILIDFGVAEEAGAGGGKVLGTPHYLAPERAMGDPPTPAADIYALGVLLYELLTGRVPLDGATPTEVIQRHISEGVPGLRGAIPGQAAAIESMIAKATRRDPAQRYPSVDDFLADIEAIERQAAISTVAMAPQRPRATVSIHNMPTQAMAAPPKAAPPPGEAPPPAGGPRPAAGARRKPPVWLLAVGAAALLAVLVLLVKPAPPSSGQTGEPGAQTASPATAAPDTVKVPPLAGLGIDVAQGTAQRVGVQLEQSAQPSEAPPGQVLGQEPAPGTEVARGALVKVVVSSGPAAPPPGADPPPPPGQGGNGPGHGKGKDKDKGNGKKDK